MQLRGGLLIEPWKAYKVYTNLPREQSVISFENAIYICTVAHQAGATFAENLNKFSAIGSGTGSVGGSGSLIPTGEWDIANSTTAGPIIEAPVELSVGYDAIINNNTVTNSGLGSYPIGGGIHVYGAEHLGVLKNDFTTTKWLTFGNAPAAYQVFCIYKDDNIDPIYDILQSLFNNQTDLNATFILGIAIIYGGASQVTIHHNTSTGNLVQQIFNTTNLNDISFGLNLSTSSLTLDNGIDLNNFTIPSTIFDGATNLKLWVGGMVGGAITSNVVSLLFPDQVNKPPMLTTQQSFTVVPPVGAVDGTMWKLISNGSYGGIQLHNNSYVIFYNTLLSIVIVYDATDELNTLGVSINNIVGQLSGLMSLQERAIVRGVIDWVTSVPTAPTPGDTFLTNDAPPGSLAPNFLYVYNGSSWIELNQPPGSVFNVSSFNIQIKYISSSGVFPIKRYITRTNSPNTIIPIVDMLAHPTNQSWVFVGNIRSSGYRHVNINDVDNVIYCILDDYSDCMFDLLDTFTKYDVTIVRYNEDALFSIVPSTLYFRNSTNSDITVRLIDSSYVLKACGELLSNSVTIPANSNLCLNVRTINNNGISTPYALLEYVSGNYIASKEVVVSVAAPSIVINDNITNFYLDVDSASAFTISLNVISISSGQVFNIYYKVTVPNTSITFDVFHGATIYSTTLSVGLTDRHHVVRFNGSSLEVY